MKKHNITEASIYIVATELVGALSAILAGGFRDFFNEYTKPPLLPPSWLFPVVWVILYAVMGFSAYLVHISESEYRNKALTIYWCQLVFNFLWSIVFFRFEALKSAVAVIVVLLGLIIAMIATFRKVNRLSANLNIPYMLWVIFATYLNIATIAVN